MYLTQLYLEIARSVDIVWHLRLLLGLLGEVDEAAEPVRAALLAAAGATDALGELQGGRDVP